MTVERKELATERLQSSHYSFSQKADELKLTPDQTVVYAVETHLECGMVNSSLWYLIRYY